MPIPKITIITPSYNQAEFLEQTIDSVLSQGYTHLEYMIFDGGSQDNSVEIIKKYAQYLTHWESQKDRGQSHAINKGLQRATGDVINWLNSDDFYEPETLKKVGEYFQQPSTEVLIGRENVVQNGKILYQKQGTDIYENNLPKTLGQARIDQPETFFSREAVQKMGLLNEKLHYLMDKEWWMRFLVYFGLENVLKVEDILVNFRLHAESKTVSQEQGFERENDLIFASLAQKLGKTQTMEQILQNTSSSPEQLLELENFPVIDQDLWEKTIQYFWLLKAEQFYVKYNFKQTKGVLRYINPNLLNKEDQKKYQILAFRSNLPPALIKILRKK